MKKSDAIQIENMNQLPPAQMIRAAQMLTQQLPNGWATLEEAMEEIKERLIPENTLLAAVEKGEVVGWGGILAPIYGGNVFELHPLVVEGSHQKKGIGRALVQALEQAAREQGGLTIYLGSDDDQGEGKTSMAKVDLYQNLSAQMANFTPGGHAAGFYLKMGYKLIGVMPDASGLGKPDLFFGKSLVRK